MISVSKTKSSEKAGEVHRLEVAARVGAEPRVVLGEVEVERRVLDGRQEDVREVLPLRHAALDRAAAEHPAPEHRVDLPVGDRLDQVVEDRRVVLVVGVDHDDDVGPAREGGRVAGLLVPAVAPVLRVDDDLEPRDRPGERHGPVPRGVVDEEDVVDPLLRDLLEASGGASSRRCRPA